MDMPVDGLRKDRNM